MELKLISINYFHLLKDYYHLIILIIFSISCTVHPQLIRSVEFTQKEKSSYVSKPQSQSITRFEMKLGYGNIHIDFGKQQEQVIVIRNSFAVKLKLMFQTYAPGINLYDTLTHKFCFQVKVTQDSLCNDIPRNNTSMFWFNMNFTVRWLSNKSGYKLSIDFPKTYEYDYSGFYYFKTFTTKDSGISGMILSNFLEIRDILFWERNIISSSPVPIKQSFKQNLSPSEIPKVFPCLDQFVPFNTKDYPYWITLEFNTYVKWAWCPVSKQIDKMREIEKTYVEDCLTNTLSRCEKQNHLCPILSGVMFGWKETILFDGTITITNAGKLNDYSNRLDGYALMCYYQSKDGYKAMKYIANSFDNEGKEFLKGLQWDPNPNQRTKFELISQLKQEIKIEILKKEFSLNAYYYAPENYTYEWYKNSKRLFNSNKWKMEPYSLSFKSTINLDIEGLYYLKLKSSSEIIQFTFTVIVLSPPILINVSSIQINSTVYLMVNSNFSITYTYKSEPTNANIYINGIQFKPEKSDRQIFLNDLSKTSSYLNNLDFYFVQNKLSGGITQYTYSLRNVLFPDTFLRGQDHNIIIEVMNEHGVSRSLLNIYVLKPPVFVFRPKGDNCTTQCSSSQPHLFRCELNTDYYTSRDVQVEKFWLVNDIRLDSLPYYDLYFKNDTKGLNVLPLISNSSKYDIAVKVLLKQAKLICRVRLLHPGSLEMLDTKLINDNRIIYDTFWDPMTMSHFSAEIKIDWEPDMNTASYTWIIFLAIALLLIVMFIFLLVKFTLQGQGKSYQIEKLEIAKGYNRDEEIIENETIKPYLRSPNNVNHYGNNSKKDSSRNLVNSSYSPPNGNGTFRPRDVLDIIDDEENAIDPSKFNEEGSFIGVYATKNNHSNLPPEIKIKKF